MYRESRGWNFAGWARKCTGGGDVSAEDAKAMRDGVHLRREIDVPEGRSFLRLGVRDIDSGRIGTVSIPVKEGSGDGGSGS
jgi:hypothetical protein